MRVRLRAAYTQPELQALYPQPHQHRRWPDHVERVNATVEFARAFLPAGQIADLSCGDAEIARRVNQSDADPILGDLAAGYEHHGPIEQTIDEIPVVDLFICCETLEHLDDPDLVLRSVRAKTHGLLISTPDGEMTDENPEHYWGWDTDGVREMLATAGFAPVAMRRLAMPAYRAAYQIWGCE